MAQSSPAEAVISQECRNAEDKRGERGGGGGGGGIETATRGGVVRFSAGMGEQQRPYPATIRYNKHLLRKRLDVEEWMDNQIRLLYDVKDDEDCDIFIDLDDVAEYETDEQKRNFIKIFITELLEKMRHLQATEVEKHSRSF
ncbi:protein phosphatase 1 regulatory subunit 14B-like isoform X2 [Symsagittifera roscoffensis]|uniref:protein phosphatase 1 regulatory subunit 14B-like isoform X2 n=1 Tax=Symsagittifera roscoffensis TaxID=84072 RepID=UPI00307B4ABF